MHLLEVKKKKKITFKYSALNSTIILDTTI
jgi:hypothetical protein